jgi:hypothetical protein
MITTAMEPPICQRLAETELARLDAISAALLSYSQPLRAPERRASKLPDGMLLVIKAAAGDAATLADLETSLGHDTKTLQEASSFYLQQQLTGVKTSAFQQLGLNDQASSDDIALHKRWLLKWLHPDRNPNKWQTQMFNGVTNAARAANTLAAPAQHIDVPVSPQALNAASHVRSHHSARMRHRPARGMGRTRVRIVNWRDVLWRIFRRMVFLLAIISTVYIGMSQFFGGGTKWALSSSDFWTK